MGTAVLVVLVIVGVLAVGLLRDSRRTGAVNQWCKTHGFVSVPQADLDREQLATWAERFRPYNATQWGIVLRGEAGGVPMVIAEHKEKPRSSPERWHTLVATHVPGLQLGSVRITAAPSQTVRRVTDALAEPGREARAVLGVEVAKPPVVYAVGSGKWAVEVASDEALSFWSSPPQAAAIDAWPHDVQLALLGDYALVRISGLIEAQDLDDHLAVATAARAFFVDASARVAAVTT